MAVTYIEKLHLANFRQFNELNIRFNKGFNILAGPNGCGKTSILAAISHCFSTNDLNYSRFHEGSELWVDLIAQNQMMRIGLPKGSIKTGEYRESQLKQLLLPPSEPGREAILTRSANEKLVGSIPLVLGANRNIKYKKIQGMQREKNLHAKTNEYLNGSRLLYGDQELNIKQWMINRYFIIEKDWAIEEKNNWDHLVSSLIEIGPFDSNFSYISTGRDLEPMFSIYGKECYLEELSSGFQAVLSIIANIIEWIEGSNPEGQRNVKTALGTVLIDELDLHLHPEWQFSLRNGLKKMFPKLQFIVTTHSPHILASAEPGEVIVIPISQEDNIYTLEPTESSYSGWSTDQILADVMGVESLENKLYGQLIREAFEFADQLDIEKLSAAISKLEKVTHPNDVVVPVLEARLASLVANDD